MSDAHRLPAAPRRLSPRPGGAVGLGLHHGLYCIGCCWALMTLLFVGGIMNVLWIAAIAIFVLAEKVFFPAASSPVLRARCSSPPACGNWFQLQYRRMAPCRGPPNGPSSGCRHLLPFHRRRTSRASRAPSPGRRTGEGATSETLPQSLSVSKKSFIREKKPVDSGLFSLTRSARIPAATRVGAW